MRIFVGLALAIAMVGSAVTTTTAAAPSGVGGTWRGSFSQVGAFFYVAEGNCVLQVKEDGTFTARITPGPGANNIVKGSTWSGTVEREGDLVTLSVPGGPATTLVRKGDTLYGVTNNPRIEADVLIRLDRVQG
jgi:hypothetical protein